MLKVGLDVGNGSIVTAVRGNGTTQMTTWASTFGVIDRGVVSVTGEKNPYPAFRIGANEYALGYDSVTAFRSAPLDSYSRDSRYDNESFRLMNHLALIAAVTQEGIGGVVECAVELGVPAESFTKGTVAKLKSWFAAPIVAERDGVPVVVVTRAVNVISQPIAVFLDQFHDDDGYVQDKQIATENVLIIDGGAGTLDLAHLRGGSIIKQVSETIGMNDVYATVLEAIRKQQPSMRLNQIDLEAQLRAQQGAKIVHYGRYDADASKVYAEGKKQVFAAIKQAVTRHFPALMEFERVLVAGGVAAAFSNEFHAWDAGFTVVEQPQQAIARGLLKHLLTAQAAGGRS